MTDDPFSPFKPFEQPDNVNGPYMKETWGRPALAWLGLGSVTVVWFAGLWTIMNWLLAKYIDLMSHLN